MGNYLEMRWGPRSHVIRRQHTIFIVVYGFGSLLLPICYGIDLALYEPGTDPPVPPWLTQARPPLLLPWIPSSSSSLGLSSSSHGALHKASDFICMARRSTL